jgi:hypothetical protein
MQKTIIFNSFYIAMQKLLNIIAFYIIIGETMWKINTIGDLSGLSKTAWRGRRADYCN